MRTDVPREKCAGELAFAALRRAFGKRYLYAGLGSRLKIGATAESEPTSSAVDFGARRSPQVQQEVELDG